MKKLPLTLLLLTSCTVGPNFQAPEVCISNTWQEEAEVTTEDPTTRWWELFEDEQLNGYIEKARLYNKSVLAAESNIIQARAQRQVTASSFYPQVGIDLNATKSSFSKNGPLIANDPTIGLLPGTLSSTTGLPFVAQFPRKQTLYNALFDATWELDLFGKTRRSVEASDAVIDERIEMKNQILLSLFGEISLDYIQLRSLQEQMSLTREKIDELKEKKEIIEQQFQSGYISRTNLESILADLSTAEALLPQIEAEIRSNVYALSVLVGDPPESLLDELLQKKPLPQTPETVALGVRSDLLRRRPDVRIAEKTLVEANAYIGVAIASFFPTINLLGDGGLQSLLFKTLFLSSSKAWAYGGDITMPLFQGGKLMGNLKAARAQYETVLQIYQQTVLSALQDTESALISYTQNLKSRDYYQEATEHHEELVALSSMRYASGLVNKLEKLDNDLSLNSARQSLLQSETSTLVNLIRLYKSLGGGWEEPGIEK